MIIRSIQPVIESRLFKGKAIVLLGPRQTGKTTLLQSVIDRLPTPALVLNGDDPTTRTLLDKPNTAEIKRIVGANRLVFIDEAQRIPGIGITAKIIIDQFRDVQLLLSGSSALDLGHEVQEPLTGRKWTYYLYPISWQEWQDHIGYPAIRQELEQRIIYGMYPDVLNNPGEEEDVLRELASSYLYKDILALAGIKKPDVLDRLVRALALQLGNEVSLNELAQLLQVDKNTVSNYIDLLEKAFVVYRLPSFSRNLRNEIKFNKKIYFYDTGIRNAILGNYQPLSQRPDKGALWENFVISERLKFLHNQNIQAHSYFWRTTRQQEIDYIEERNGEVHAFEVKWQARKKTKPPAAFTNAYKASFETITPVNIAGFLTGR